MGEPKGQPRPRAFVRNGQARVYDAGTAEGWKSQVALAAREAGAAGLALECPVSLVVECRFPRPKYHFNAKGTKPTAPTLHTSVPDADNVAKAILDALTVVHVWRDDSQVYRLAVTKRYVLSGEIPGASITLSAEQDTHGELFA